MNTRGIRRVSDTIEVVRYTPAKSLKIAKWLTKQGARKVPMIFDAENGPLLTDDFGYPQTVGSFVGYGDPRVESRAPGDVEVGRVLWFPAEVLGEGKVVFATDDSKGWRNEPRLTTGFEEVV